MQHLLLRVAGEADLLHAVLEPEDGGSISYYRIFDPRIFEHRLEEIGVQSSRFGRPAPHEVPGGVDLLQESIAGQIAHRLQAAPADQLRPHFVIAMQMQSFQAGVALEQTLEELLLRQSAVLDDDVLYSWVVVEVLQDLLLEVGCVPENV